MKIFGPRLDHGARCARSVRHDLGPNQPGPSGRLRVRVRAINLRGKTYAGLNLQYGPNTWLVRAID